MQFLATTRRGQQQIVSGIFLSLQTLSFQLNIICCTLRFSFVRRPRSQNPPLPIQCPWMHRLALPSSQAQRLETHLFVSDWEDVRRRLNLKLSQCTSEFECTGEEGGGGRWKSGECNSPNAMACCLFVEIFIQRRTSCQPTPSRPPPKTRRSSSRTGSEPGQPGKRRESCDTFTRIYYLTYNLPLSLPCASLNDDYVGGVGAADATTLGFALSKDPITCKL